MFGISRRELLLGVAMFVGLSLISIAITTAIKEAAERKYLTYQQALKVTEDEKFAYGVKTNVGNILASGRMTALQPQSMDEIKGEYGMIRKVTERYNQKTRTVSYSCGTAKSPQTCYRTETYYEWDYQKDDTKKTVMWDVMSVPMGNVCSVPERNVNLNNDYKGSQEHNDSYAYPDGMGWFDSVGELRYSWEVSEKEQSGSIFARAFDKTVTDPLGGSCVRFYPGQSIEQVMGDAAPNNALVAWLSIGFVIVAMGVYTFTAVTEEIV